MNIEKIYGWLTAKQENAPMSVSLRDTTQNLSHEQLSKLAD
ncbi:hypothetical protein [Trichormus azollae]|nr:hypothetical protein [Trichormus azollae]